MMSSLVQVPYTCKFFNKACVEDECPAFEHSRAWTEEELQGMYAADIMPSFPRRGKHCLRYGDIPVICMVREVDQ